MLLITVLLFACFVSLNGNLVYNASLKVSSNPMEYKYFQGDMRGMDYSLSVIT